MPSTVALDDTTIEAAGALIADEQTSARRTLPGLPPTYSTPETCTASLQRLRETGDTGVVAVEHGRTLALMVGNTHETYALTPAEGFAVAPDLDDPTTVLARLYGELALRFIAEGVARHFLNHVALPRLAEAVANLGFGRHHVYAAQPAVPRRIPTAVQVRIGGLEDLDSIARLARVELEHRATPPIYSAPDHRTLEAITSEHRALHDGGALHFIATLDGRDVGLLAVERGSLSPRLCPDGQPHIGPTATDPDARGRGVGRALVAAALTWASTHGHGWMSVDFEPSNPLSRPFWLGVGFRPVGYSVLRSIHPAHLPTT